MSDKIHTEDGELYKGKYTYDVLHLKHAIYQYHEKTEKDEKAFPDLAGLLIYLNIPDEEYNMMIEDDDFKPAFLYAKRRRESWLNRRAIDNKAANGCKILLMQEENGGYSDRPVDNKKKEFVVKLEGVGIK